jgi:hypothetical protein
VKKKETSLMSPHPTDLES